MLCNHMIKEHESTNNVRYSWIIRLRLDSVFFAPFPRLPKEAEQKDVIYSWCPGRDMFADSFNVGPPEIMHPFLDRMFDFGSRGNTLNGEVPLWGILYPWFTAEDYMATWLKFKGVEMHSLQHVYTCPFRHPHERARTPTNMPNDDVIPWKKEEDAWKGGRS
eukprot:TRINITY_DN21002_c0_g1_i1.p1 TRINITY_DN21002_c0_g1~~TRINITY_DN21002_c0_g1_i1.p1  ORF type:complete len:162 (+),score=19.92 TRINITY_DN21002_c0_g1_i1:309-794(+)